MIIITCACVIAMFQAKITYFIYTQPVNRNVVYKNAWYFPKELLEHTFQDFFSLGIFSITCNATDFLMTFGGSRSLNNAFCQGG